MTPPTLTEAATAYIMQDLAILALEPKTKRARFKGKTLGGLHNPFRTRAQVEKHWTEFPADNVGVALKESDLSGCDIDGPRGWALAQRYGVFAEPRPTVASPGQPQPRAHVYFRRPPGGISTKILDGERPPQFGLRGDGSYFVLPPSIHDTTGLPYEWQTRLDALTDLPPSLLELHRTLNGASGPAVKLGEIEVIPEGGRHETLRSYVGRLFRKRLPPEEVLALVRAVNVTLCRPPLPEDELGKIVTYVAEKEAAEQQAVHERFVERAKALPALPPPSMAVVHHDADDGADLIPVRVWPTMAPVAFTGPIGDYVHLVERHTEADPAAVLAQALVAFGSAAGREAYLKVGRVSHHVNENVLVVGTTAAGRKGQALAEAMFLVARAAPGWAEARVFPGALSTGEGLLYLVRDPVWSVNKKGERQLVDEGESDKRALVVQPEFGAAFRMMRREGNTLSSQLRSLWDGPAVVRILTKTARVTATRPHVSIVAHITPGELEALLQEHDISGGLLNRFLIVAARRTGRVPSGGMLADDMPALKKITEDLIAALAQAQDVGLLSRSAAFTALWEAEYDRLTDARPGLVGDLLARGAPHVLRLSALYALADQRRTLELDDLKAALAVWRYVEDSVAYFFGTRLRNPKAERIRLALEQAGASGVDPDTDQYRGVPGSRERHGHGELARRAGRGWHRGGHR